MDRMPFKKIWWGRKVSSNPQHIFPKTAVTDGLDLRTRWMHMLKKLTATQPSFHGSSALLTPWRVYVVRDGLAGFQVDFPFSQCPKTSFIYMKPSAMCIYRLDWRLCLYRRQEPNRLSTWIQMGTPAVRACPWKIFLLIVWFPVISKSTKLNKPVRMRHLQANHLWRRTRACDHQPADGTAHGHIHQRALAVKMLPPFQFLEWFEVLKDQRTVALMYIHHEDSLEFQPFQAVKDGQVDDRGEFLVTIHSVVEGNYSVWLQKRIYRILNINFHRIECDYFLLFIACSPKMAR